MRVCYSPDYQVALPLHHPFPMGKYTALFDILLNEGLIHYEDVMEPQEAEWADLMLVHTADYLGAFASGSLDRAAVRRLGLPWSSNLVRRSRLAVQGTMDAARFALDDGIAANLAGGTHHAFPDHGEGYCVLNDVAVAIRSLRKSAEARRALVIDLDVHQGNGTAAVFEADDSVYTFSMHGQNNYPLRKVRSSRDIGLPDRASDELYLDTLDKNLPEVFDACIPDIVFYLAGVDIAAGDRHGRLGLTPEGVRRRDALVLDEVHRRGAPAVLVLSGGYARTVLETANLHAMVHRECHRIFH